MQLFNRLIGAKYGAICYSLITKNSVGVILYEIRTYNTCLALYCYIPAHICLYKQIFDSGTAP